MKALQILVIATMVFITFPVLEAQAGRGWIVYWDGSYHGKVIDLETKEPIEDAVVVAVYTVSCYRFVQTNSKQIGVQEVLTQEDGSFRIRPFWTITTPECLPSYTWFKVFKPWYGSFPVSAAVIGEGPFPKIYSPENPDLRNPEEIFRDGGVVELPPLKTLEELRKNDPPHPVSSNRLRKKLKYFRKQENEWRKALGYDPIQ